MYSLQQNRTVYTANRRIFAKQERHSLSHAVLSVLIQPDISQRIHPISDSSVQALVGLGRIVGRRPGAATQQEQNDDNDDCDATDNGKCALHLVILATRTRRSSISPPARTCRQKRTEFSLTPDRKLSMLGLIRAVTVIHRLKIHGIIEKHRIGWGLILFQFWCKMSP